MRSKDAKRWACGPHGAHQGSQRSALAKNSRAIEPAQTQAITSPRTSCARSGTEYMARIRARHDQLAASSQAGALAIETLRDAFAGLYVQFAAEDSRDRDQCTLSLHFLTPRLNRSRFVTAFCSLRDRSSMNLLLTGPGRLTIFRRRFRRSTTLRSGIEGIAQWAGNSLTSVR